MENRIASEQASKTEAINLKQRTGVVERAMFDLGYDNLKLYKAALKALKLAAELAVLSPEVWSLQHGRPVWTSCAHFRAATPC